MYLTGLMLGCDVRDVDQGILEAVTIKHLAAGQRIIELWAFAMESFSPVVHIAYLRAVQSL